jgi:phytoene dehydrogenase-like protein
LEEDVGRLAVARYDGLTMPEPKRILIIGGGHNGLVAAFYLARAGFKPLVLERREIVGGAAVTEEFYPGFRVSSLAHTAGPLRADIARDIRLKKFGCEMIHPDPRVFAPAPDGSAILFYDDHARTAASIERISAKDASRYTGFADSLVYAADVFAQVCGVTPPSIDKPSPEDLWNLLKIGRGVRNLGKKRTFDLLRWGPMAVADFVAEFFETDLLRAAIATRGIFGCAMGPWSAGSTAVLLLRAAADSHPVGSASFPRGGLGALTDALAESARAAGAEIRTGAEVARILTKDGAAVGVALADGEEIRCDAVVSGADPKRTFFHLVDPSELDPTFVLRIKNLRASGTVAKVNIALGGCPSFPAATALAGPDGLRAALSGRIHIGPGIDYLERAFDASKYGEFSPEPWLDVTIPTLADPSLAPMDKHVLSAYVQFAPCRLKSGDWTSRREALGKTVLKTLEAYAPGISNLVEGMQIITPEDLEKTYGLTGGHIYHTELALDQLFTMRPVLDWARYRTPIRGLYLCGSGTHPGNGLTGASGANAAREISRDLR